MQIYTIFLSFRNFKNNFTLMTIILKGDFQFG